VLASSSASFRYSIRARVGWCVTLCCHLWYDDEL